MTYWIHRSFHSKFLFKHFHSVHHRYFQPTPWSVTAIHPVELIVVQLAMVTPIFIYPVHWCEYIGTRSTTFALKMYCGRTSIIFLLGDRGPIKPRDSFRIKLISIFLSQFRFMHWLFTRTITESCNTLELLSRPNGGSPGNRIACSTTTTISTVTSIMDLIVLCGIRSGKFLR